MLEVSIAGRGVLRPDYAPGRIGVVIASVPARHLDLPGSPADFFRRLHDAVSLVTEASRAVLVTKLGVHHRPHLLAPMFKQGGVPSGMLLVAAIVQQVVVNPTIVGLAVIVNRDRPMIGIVL